MPAAGTRDVEAAEHDVRDPGIVGIDGDLVDGPHRQRPRIRPRDALPRRAAVDARPHVSVPRARVDDLRRGSRHRNGGEIGRLRALLPLRRILPAAL